MNTSSVQVKALLQPSTLLAAGGRALAVLSSTSKSWHEELTSTCRVHVWLQLLADECCIVVGGQLRKSVQPASLQRLFAKASLCQTWRLNMWILAHHADAEAAAHVLEAAALAVKRLRSGPRLCSALGIGPQRQVRPHAYQGAFRFDSTKMAQLMDAWDKNDEAALAALSGDNILHAQNDTDSMGPDRRAYMILKPVCVSGSVRLGGTKIADLPRGSLVSVLRVHPHLENGRVRALIQQPPGWISLSDSKSGKVFAARTHLPENITFSISFGKVSSEPENEPYDPLALPGNGRMLALDLQRPNDEHCLVYLAHPQFAITGRWSWMTDLFDPYCMQAPRRIFQCRGAPEGDFKSFLDFARQAHPIRFLLVATGVDQYGRDTSDESSLFGQPIKIPEPWPDLALVGA